MLTQLPIRLPNEPKVFWKKFILDCSDCTQEELQQALEEKATDLGKTVSLRSPLSRFLNGHGEELYQWLKNGSPKGQWLADVLGVELDQIRARLFALLPNLTDHKLTKRSFFEFPIKLRNFFTDEVCLLDDLLKERRLPLLASNYLGITHIGQAIAQTQIEAIQNREDFEHLGRHDVLLPTLEDFEKWLGGLENLGVIKASTVELVGEEPLCSELLHMVDVEGFLELIKFLDGGGSETNQDIGVMRAEFQKTRFAASETQLISSWLNSPDFGEFALKWLLEAGKLDLSIPNVLGLVPFRDNEVSTGEIRRLLTELEDSALRAALVSYCERDIVVELEDRNHLLREGDGWRMSAELEAVSRAVLPLVILPEHLHKIQVVGNYELIRQAVSFCSIKDLEGFVALGLDCQSRWDSPWLVLAILEGLTLNKSLSDLSVSSMERLWATSVCGELLDPQGFDQILEKVSRKVDSKLPLLNSSGPLDDLKRRAAWHQGLGERIDAELMVELKRIAPYQIPFAHRIDAKIIQPRELLRLASKEDAEARQEVVKQFQYQVLRSDESDDWIKLVKTKDIADWSLSADTQLDGLWSYFLERYVEGETELGPSLAQAMKLYPEVFPTVSALVELSQTTSNPDWDEVRGSWEFLAPVPGEKPDEICRKLRFRPVGAYLTEIISTHLSATAELIKREHDLVHLWSGVVELPHDALWEEWARVHSDGHLSEWCEQSGLTGLELSGPFENIEWLFDKPDVAGRAWEVMGTPARRLLLVTMPKPSNIEFWWKRAQNLESKDVWKIAQHWNLPEFQSTFDSWVMEESTAEARLRRFDEVDDHHGLSYIQMPEDVLAVLENLDGQETAENLKESGWVVTILNRLALKKTEGKGLDTNLKLRVWKWVFNPLSLMWYRSFSEIERNRAIHYLLKSVRRLEWLDHQEIEERFNAPISARSLPMLVRRFSESNTKTMTREFVEQSVLGLGPDSWDVDSMRLVMSVFERYGGNLTILVDFLEKAIQYYGEQNRSLHLVYPVIAEAMMIVPSSTAYQRLLKLALQNE